MRSKSVRLLSSEDAAYLAGLIDGEGTITLTRRHMNERRQLVVSIANTERALLDFVAAAVGAGKITNKRIAKDIHTPSFCFTIANRQALGLLRQLHHQLKGYKRLRAELALRDYVRLTPRNGKYTTELSRRRAEFESTFLGISPTNARPSIPTPTTHSRRD